MLLIIKIDMRQEALLTREELKIHSDMRHEHLFNLTRVIGISKRQGHATLPLLKIDITLAPLLLQTIASQSKFNGSGPLNSTWRHGPILNSTCDIGP